MMETPLFRAICASAHDTGLPDKSVHMICFSPPYWGLRSYSGEQAVEWPAVSYAPMPGLPGITIPGCDPACEHEWTDAGPRYAEGRRGNADSYGKQVHLPKESMSSSQGAFCARCGGWKGGLGMEPTIKMYIGHMMLVMREMRRILRDDGTCWVNLGDSFSASPGQRKSTDKHGPKQATNVGANEMGSRHAVGLKPKDLCLIPQRFALAAQADGWWVRADIVWTKRNALPESVQDRPGRSHETIWMLAKSKTYFYDHIAVRQPAAAASIARTQQKTFATQTGGRKDYANGTNPNRNARKTLENFAANPGRNLRDTWDIPTQSSKANHFATFPEALVEIMIRAGTSERGCCPKCGSPHVRVVEKPDMTQRPTRSGDAKYPTSSTATSGTHINDNWEGTPKSSGQAYQEWRNANPDKTVGWKATCEHDLEPIPCVIADPCIGSGTSAIVAIRLGRRCIGIDISQEYLDDVLPKRMGEAIQMRLV